MTTSPLAALIGIALALALGAFATALRLDRDRAFYPVMLMVIASYHVLFGIMSSDASIVTECAICGGFMLAAVIGFRRSLWLVAAELAALAVLDSAHCRIVQNNGVPPLWPPF